MLANFHGHHRKALANMAQTAFNIDMVLELRDARAPLASINPLFDKALKGKEKLILYTKKDLSTLTAENLRAWHGRGETIDAEMFMQIDSRNERDAERVLDRVKAFHGSLIPPPPLGVRLLVTGMPNAGKSTFLNTLRRVGTGTRVKAARTGEMPGVTRNLSQTVAICRDPTIYVIDTPGVFVPMVRTTEDMIKMCLVNAVNRSRIDPTVQADFLLYRMNKHYYGENTGRQSKAPYEAFLGHPTNDVTEMLYAFAKRVGIRTVDFEENTAALRFIQFWSDGKFGRLVLEDDLSGEAYVETLKTRSDYLRDFTVSRTRQGDRLRKKFLYR